MITLISGDYELKPTDTLITNWNPDLAYKNVLNQTSNFVLFAESIGLKKQHVDFICKNATTNITIVATNRKLFKNLRVSKNLKKEFNDDCDDLNPFDITKTMLTTTKRKDLFEYLKLNRINLFMPVKIMISNMDQLCQQNKLVIAFLDLHLFRVNNEMLHAMIAFRMKPEPYLKFLKWNYPKKEEQE